MRSGRFVEVSLGMAVALAAGVAMAGVDSEPGVDGLRTSGLREKWIHGTVIEDPDPTTIEFRSNTQPAGRLHGIVIDGPDPTTVDLRSNDSANGLVRGTEVFVLQLLSKTTGIDFVLERLRGRD